MPAFTAVPTASAVCAVGAMPVPGRRRRVDGGLDLAATGRGHHRTDWGDRARAPLRAPVDVEPFVGLGPTVIEDAAQAHGARSVPPDARSHCSFYPTKNLGGIGDGGAVRHRRRRRWPPIRSRRLRSPRHDRAVRSRGHQPELPHERDRGGWLRLQLAVLAADNAAPAVDRPPLPRCRAVARLAGRPRRPRYHLCVCARCPIATRSGRRSTAAGVATAVHYPLALDQQPAYRHFTSAATPVAEAWAARCVSAAVLSRADRRRGRARSPTGAAQRRARRDGAATRRSRSVSAFFPCYNDEHSIAEMVARRRTRRSSDARRRLRDHRGRRRVHRWFARRARSASPTRCPSCGSCATPPTAATAGRCSLASQRRPAVDLLHRW